MDVTTLAVTDTAVIHLKNAKGDFLTEGDKPITVTIYGPGSKQHAAVEARQSTRALKRMQDNDGKVTMAPPAERDAEAAEDLTALTVGFDGLTYGDKTGTELTHAIYSDPRLGFIGKQVAKAISDWGTFAGNSKSG